MSDYGQLKPPSATGIEVFDKVLENNPDADMRAIPNEWLLKERGLTAEFGDKIDRLTDALEQALDERDKHTTMIMEQRKRIEQLDAALKKANGRERPAFMAGLSAVMNNMDVDEEQAWQQYRCRDDTDWTVGQLSAGESTPVSEKRCTITGNPCLTYTWAVGSPPDCECGRKERHGLGTYSDGMVEFGYRSGSSADDPQSVPDSEQICSLITKPRHSKPER